ncbi:MAG TPA: hypothetical protein VMV21_13650 [Vicinamibacteria bacterium]|nr:hypothetical protein [Vicinamibacteria bacterium]
MLPMRTCGRLVAVAGALLLLLAPEARSTTLVQMNLADLAGRANKIFRGTVLSVKPGTVAAGGGELPILIYRVRVDEKFKGEFGEGKQADFVEIRMVGAIKEPKRDDNLRKFSLWRDVPRLDRGQEYVLFTTTPSRIGLSTTVGLGQGTFQIRDAGKEETAVNAFGNAGLARGMAANTPITRASGPLSYRELAQAIRSVVAK